MSVLPWAFPDRLLASVLLATLFPAAALAGPRPSAAQCDRGKLAGRFYIECLEKVLRDDLGERALRPLQRRPRDALLAQGIHCNSDV